MPVDLSGFNLAFSMDLGHVEIDPDVQDTIRNALERLLGAGAKITKVELSWTPELQNSYGTNIGKSSWQLTLATISKEWRERMDPNVVKTY